jgi:hypothetical protein
MKNFKHSAIRLISIFLFKKELYRGKTRKSKRRQRATKILKKTIHAEIIPKLEKLELFQSK